MRRRAGWAAGLLIAAVLLAGASAGFRMALAGYRYSFPRDHFEHPEFRTEWWYYTGNLRSEDGRRFGFELVFFRQAQRRGPAANRSAWRVDDLYLGHAALTDIDERRFVYHKRLNRAGPGIAGANYQKRRVWNGNWSAQWRGEEQTLEATAPEFRLMLNLRPRTPPVIHGVNGISRKGPGPGQASHYVSFPRLHASGSLETGGRRYRVAGLAWMDHEWFSHQLAPGQSGWDWFSVQLEDGSAVMLFQLRRTDGTVDPHSAGTYVAPSGLGRHLAREDFELTPLAYWRSPKTGARYPVRWRIEAPSLGLKLDCRAAMDAQELVSENGAGPNYWEGAVVYTGSATGSGYLEMTGYDKPVKLE